MKTSILLAAFFLFFSCKSKFETTKPTVASITESIYASGLIKSKNQYEAFVTVNGNINQVFVTEGDTVKKGQAILSIANVAQHLASENAQLAVGFADLGNNREKLNDASVRIGLAKANLQNDSVLFYRQKSLWEQQVGTKVDFEARELAYKNAKAALYSAKVTYDDLKRQLIFASSQARKNLSISTKLESDYTLTSDLDGVVYSLLKEKGEIVSPQTALAVIGDAGDFILEMQVDEYDILKIRTGMKAFVTMDSYKSKVFEARVTKIFPMMNTLSKTFRVEAKFTEIPRVLYPNISFEANIIIQTKPHALLIPRSFMIDDSTVMKSNGEKAVVKTGLKDYRKIEILGGISSNDELRTP